MVLIRVGTKVINLSLVPLWKFFPAKGQAPERILFYNTDGSPVETIDENEEGYWQAKQEIFDNVPYGEVVKIRQ